MKIKHEFPPNYQEIVKHFPSVKNNIQVVFSYGDDLYVPSGNEIIEHLMVHEQTHQKQQNAIGVDVWWSRYFDDKEFRLSQEIEAYRNQYLYIKETANRKDRKILLHKLSEDLSSSIYGNLVSKSEAMTLINNI